MSADPPLNSTEWQRTAARKAFQNDLRGAIEAMENAVRADPDNFHHWMWLRRLYEQAGDPSGAKRCARQGLRCLEEKPNPAISPEERTRLIVRAALAAGERGRAEAAVEVLELHRRNDLEACENAGDFPAWRVADLFAAPIFETLLELRDLLGRPVGSSGFRARYAGSLRRALALAPSDVASEEDLAILRRRLEAVEASGP